MDKQIVTTLLIVAAVVCFALAFQAVFPAVLRSSDAMVSAGRVASDRLRTDIALIHVTGELDAQGLWRDVNSDGDMDVFLWVKNTGSLSIAAVESCDVFFGPEGAFDRVPHEGSAKGAYPYWTYELTKGDRWEPTTTLEITVHHALALPAGRYYVKVVTGNGCAVESFFSM